MNLKRAIKKVPFCTTVIDLNQTMGLQRIELGRILKSLDFLDSIIKLLLLKQSNQSMKQRLKIKSEYS